MTTDTVQLQLQDTDLNTEACSHLAKRGILGSFMYIAIWSLILLVTPMVDKYPTASCIMLGALTLQGATRAWLGIKFESLFVVNSRRWLLAYTVSMVFVALIWGGATALILKVFTLEWTGYLMGFSTAGIVAGGAISLSTHFRLQIAYICLTLIPAAFVLFAIGSPQALALGGLFIFDLGYLTIIGKNLNNAYWVALRNNELLVKRAHELDEARVKAESLERAKSGFLANMNHELRTPLNAIIGFAQVLAKDSSIPSEAKEHIEVINRNGTYLFRLINQVLELSKIEAGGVGLEQTVFEPGKLFDELREMFAMKVEQKGLRLVFETSANFPLHIRTDDVKLRQVLINLLANAVKFTARGQITLRASFDGPPPERKGGEVPLLFSITDTGPGMTEKELGSLFRSFTQFTVGRKSREGTGLGLAISRQYINLLGGDIEVQSKPGQGSTFTFGIPVEVMDTTGPSIKLETNCAVGLKPGQPKNRILIVDDSPDNRALLTTLLKPMGFDLKEADNGMEALEICTKWQPHLIWMDIYMPIMDGIEACRQIRNLDDVTPRPAIVAVTASPFKKKLDTAASDRFDDFLRKPFSATEVFELIDRHLGPILDYVDDEALTTLKVSKPDSTFDALGVMPHQLIERLKTGARQADWLMLSDTIEQVKEIKPNLADNLDRLLEEFRYGEILLLLEQDETGENS